MKTTPCVLIAALALGLSGCGRGERSAASDMPTAAHAEEEGHVRLSPAQMESAGIGTAQVGASTIRDHLPLYGVIAPNAERVREVAARFPGAIRTVTKRVGDAVKQGETLATVESDESLQTYSLVAPLAGVMTARTANPGEHTGGKALFTVADLTTVWVEMALFPRDIAKVRIGQAVRVKSSDGSLSAEGKVIYVAPFGSSNQTLSARVLLDNRERKWPPGLYVTAEVTLGSTPVPLAIATRAVQTLGDRTVVFVQGEDGFEPRPVQLGRSDGDFIEVLSGLAPGDTYATNNSFILKAELGKGEAQHED